MDFVPICRIALLETQLEFMTGYLGILIMRAELEKIKLEE